MSVRHSVFHGLRRLVPDWLSVGPAQTMPSFKKVVPSSIVVGELERVLITRHLQWHPHDAAQIVSDVETVLDKSLFLPFPAMLAGQADHWGIKVNPMTGVHALSVSFTTANGYEVQTGRLITTNPIPQPYRDALANPDRRFRLGETFRSEGIDYDPIVIGCREAEMPMQGGSKPLTIYFQPNFISWVEFRREILRMGRSRVRKRA